MQIKSRGIVIVYKTNILDMTQYPSLLNSLTFTPAFAATNAPPERKLCNENSRSCIRQWNIFLSQYPVLMLRYLYNVATGHNSELPLAI